MHHCDGACPLCTARAIGTLLGVLLVVALWTCGSPRRPRPVLTAAGDCGTLGAALGQTRLPECAAVHY